MDDFVVEVDAMPGGFVCSGSYKGLLGRPIVKEAAAGKHPLSKLFSKAQRKFYADCAPEGVEIDDLKVLGPVTVLKLKFAPPEYGRRLVAEVWVYPDGSRILERRPSARRPSRSRWRPRPRRSSPGGASTSGASSRPRPAPPWSSSRADEVGPHAPRAGDAHHEVGGGAFVHAVLVGIPVVLAVVAGWVRLGRQDDEADATTSTTEPEVVDVEVEADDFQATRRHDAGARVLRRQRGGRPGRDPRGGERPRGGTYPWERSSSSSPPRPW